VWQILAPADKLLTRPAEYSKHGRVGIEDLPIQTEDANPDRRSFEHGPEGGFGSL